MTSNLNKLSFLILLLSIVSCGESSRGDETSETSEMVRVKDDHSYADLSKVAVKHMHLDLNFDFPERRVMGTVTYKLTRNKGDELVLDVKDLNIHKIFIKDKDQDRGLDYKISPPNEIMGSALKVQLPEDTDSIKIFYSTQPNSAALQWLTPEQTADKRLPFVYTQGQAILTRTWIPCQDSPGARITYSAQVSVQPGMLALMSAENPTELSEDGNYSFRMDQPIPPYLIAFAAGQLEFVSLGPTTGVYAEQSMIEKAVYEFGETQDMMQAAEALYGPYQWERYDILVLPPSFPFGGMENPRLTFVTPTILAGDRSLTALIAHELAHSWSGNLVTNATWNDFWLNEGFTVYFERRIMEALYGEDYKNMLALLGYQDLQHEVKSLGKQSKDTHLKLFLKGRDPDEGMTDIAYEKGAYLLTLLEQKVGREKFDAFLKQYFEDHKFQTMTTEVFVDYLDKNLVQPEGLDVDLDKWIYGPGIPDDLPVPESDKFNQVDAQVIAIAKGQIPDQSVTAQWSTHEWLHLLRHLPGDLSSQRMAQLDETYGFSQSGNSEIRAAWFELSINNGYADRIMPQIEEFLVDVGRRKFLTPIYGALKDNGYKEEALDIYSKARGNYHSVSRNTIDELLDV